MSAHGTHENGRRGRLLARLEPFPPDRRQRLEHICGVTASQVGVDGAGVTVVGSADAARTGRRDQAAATGLLTRRLEDLQLTTGEGPCLDTCATGVPVLAGSVDAVTSRWPGFGPEALAAGASALFSLPLQVGAVRFGSLGLHRWCSGPLSRDQLADALTLAALATEALIELTGATPAGPDGEGGDRASPAGWLPDVHADVHVASGMISARHGVDVGTALVRIRAQAFASGEAIGDTARRIVAREPVLDGEPERPR